METLGRYQIVGELGRGGGGVVYVATDPKIGRKVAIKTLPAHISLGNDELRQRLLREARSAGGLSHPNIVTVYELSEDTEPVYIVMEYVAGKTITEMMSEGERIAPGLLVSILRQCADALDFAHAQGIVHRDIKPPNIIVTENGLAKVADFGVAKILNSNSVNLTQVGMAVGTAHYIPPEQVTEREVDGRSDQFSLAVIAYETIAGTRPFEGDSAIAVMYLIVNEEAPPIHEKAPQIPAAVDTVIQKALQKKKEDRYPTCNDFVDALEEALLSSPAALTGSLPEPRRRPGSTGTRLQTHTIAAAAVAAVPAKASEEKSQPAPVAAQPVAARSSLRPALLAIAGVSLVLAATLVYRSGTHSSSSAAQPATPVSAPTRAPVNVEPPKRQPVETVRKEPVKTSEKNATESKPRTLKAQAERVPPPVAREEAAAPVPELPVEEPGKYRGPPLGRVQWTGTLAPSATLSIAGSQASTGGIAGRGLPSQLAITVEASPPELRVVEQPRPANRYRLVLSNPTDHEINSITIRWKEKKD